MAARCANGAENIPMTDRELVLELCRRLLLDERPSCDKPPSRWCFTVSPTEITIGAGAGFYGYHTSFTFGSDDVLLRHGVYR